MVKSTAASDQKPYHHGDLRQSLIDAACEHLIHSGADTLSLRALARTVGVSQTAPYRHFDSKAALFRAIALYGFQLLASKTRAVANQYPDDPDLALIEVGVAYIEFATSHPEKYQLFFDSSLVDFAQSEDLVAAGNAAFAVLTDTIQRGIDQGIFIDEPVIEVAATIWASVHGMASLLLSKEHAIEEQADISPAMQAMKQLSATSRPTLERFVNSIRPQC